MLVEYVIKPSTSYLACLLALSPSSWCLSSLLLLSLSRCNDRSLPAARIYPTHPFNTASSVPLPQLRTCCRLIVDIVRSKMDNSPT